MVLIMKLNKTIIKKVKKRRLYSSFKDNILVVDLPDMQLISKCNKGIMFLLYVIDLFFMLLMLRLLF